jgi:imidazolonepropionase-like amidohydrolase
MRRCSLVLVACCLATPAAADTRNYDLLIAGRVAGALTVTREGAHERIHFEYHDRGRGPLTDTELTLAPDGTLARLDIRGHQDFGEPVDEHFERDAKRARWRSTMDHGEGDAARFYVSAGGPVELDALLAAALTRAGKPLAVLPGGEARLTRAATLDKLGLYAIDGLDFSPSLLWLDGDGVLFAEGDALYMVIRRGEAARREALVAAQQAYIASCGAADFARLAEHPKALVYRDVRLFDARHAQSREGQTVVVVGDKIVAAGASVALPPGATVVDGRGKTLLPGLWDMHVHLNANAGPLDIGAGVTTVRDLGNDDDVIDGLARAWDEGRGIGPHVIIAGIIDGRGPLTSPTKVLVDTPEEARRVVADYHKRGYPQIKIYNSVKPPLVPLLASLAHAAGMRVSGHVPTGMSVREVVLAGYDEIQHIYHLANELVPGTRELRGMERLEAAMRGLAHTDLSSPPVRELVAFLRDHHTVIDATLTIDENLLTARAGQVMAGYVAIADAFPVAARRGLAMGGMPVTPETDALHRAAFAKLLGLTKALHDAGVRLVAGTDELAGFSVHRELELYVQAGMTPAEVLQMATFGAAQVMGRDKIVGAIEPGLRADLVLVDGDPTARISDVRRTVEVVRGGVRFSAAAVRAACNVRAQ